VSTYHTSHLEIEKV